MTSLARALAVLALAFSLADDARAEEPRAALPGDYRTWTHVRSMVVTDEDHGMYGFHDVYANAAALRTLRSGQKPLVFPDGATFVVSIYEVKQEQGIVRAGAKQRTVVQAKAAGARATGGWRFGSYDPSGKPLAIDANRCFACHAQAKDTDLVFTSFNP
jgi:hypothetical protein